MGLFAFNYTVWCAEAHWARGQFENCTKEQRSVLP